MIEQVSGTATLSAVGSERIAPPKPTAADRAKDQSPSDAAAATAEAVETALKAQDPPILGQNERLSITRDADTGMYIYRSVDRESGEVLRQWPAESMLQFKAYIRKVTGLMIDRQA